MVRGEGIGAGLDPVLVSIEVSQIVLEEADLPDLVVDFADAHELLCQRRTQVDLPRLPTQMRPQRVMRTVRSWNGYSGSCGGS